MSALGPHALAPGVVLDLVVVRAPNWLGDSVMALPALQALRRGLPRARITLVGPWAQLLAGQGLADVLLSYPRSAGERRRFNAALGQERADLAILLPNSLESALAARRWGAARRLGFDTDGRRPLLTDPVPVPTPRRHQVDEYAILLEPLGIEISERTPAWARPADPGADREVEALFAAAGLGARPRIVGLHLGAAFGPSKLWPAESFGRLATRLAGLKLSPLLLGGADDATTAATVTAAARRPPASLVGRDRPALLPRVLSRLACLVSGDTGVAHLAAALGVPTVTLFGPTDPARTAPRGTAARALSRDTPCAPCFLTACPIEHICLDALDVDTVERHVRQLVLA